jgi:hypothetical protein
MAAIRFFAALLAVGSLLIAAPFVGNPAHADPASTPSPTTPPEKSPARPSPPSCDIYIPEAHTGAPVSVVVELDPDTLWRPRGGEVRFTIAKNGPSGMPSITNVAVCFGWSQAAGTKDTRAGRDTSYLASPLVRSVLNTDGKAEYAARVPNLPDADGLWSRLKGEAAQAFTGIYAIPVADMQIIVQLNGQNNWTAVALPVGITNVKAALVTLALFLIAASLILWRWAPKALLGGRTIKSAGFLRAGSQHVLALISSPNGVASLSQFQIMLWTFVVGAAAVYVMVLSGNLIAISTGTLTLLGIAGGTSVLARIAPRGASPVPTTPAPLGTPYWAQILVNGTDGDTPEIDVTRVQMLIFTLISAAFVAVKVAVSYGIPEIPDNFLILMGISNGIYIAGRQLPTTPK